MEQDVVTYKKDKTPKEEYRREFVRQYIGNALQEAREARGWTRYELSKVSGIGEAHIMRIEKGLYSIRIDVLNKLCAALETRITFPLVGKISVLPRSNAKDI